MKIGILGGGQLGRMFIQNALNYPNEIHILDPDSEAPCSTISHKFVVGNFNDYKTVLDFGQNVDIIGIEIEHVNIEALKELEKQGKKVVPKPEIVEIFQDKGIQKEFYRKNNLATAPFYVIENATEIDLNKIQLPFVQKLRKGGYDGKGVQIIKSEKDLEKLWNEASVIEQCADIEKELAVIFAKNDHNEIAIFPAVEMVFNDELNLVDYLITPAHVEPHLYNIIHSLVKDYSKVIDSSGIFAVELFLNKNGEIWINETAPRVHNSGHHTIEANECSQFEMMFRAMLNLPFNSIKQKYKYAAMINLVGENNFEGIPIIKNYEELFKKHKVFFHWYGKKVTKPGRKMGHITILGKDYKSIKEKINFVKEKVKIISE